MNGACPNNFGGGTSRTRAPPLRCHRHRLHRRSKDAGHHLRLERLLIQSPCARKIHVSRAGSASFAALIARRVSAALMLGTPYPALSVIVARAASSPEECTAFTRSASASRSASLRTAIENSELVTTFPNRSTSFLPILS